jgi:hypothetical protein
MFPKVAKLLKILMFYCFLPYINLAYGNLILSHPSSALHAVTTIFVITITVSSYEKEDIKYTCMQYPINQTSMFFDQVMLKQIYECCNMGTRYPW